MAGKYIDCKDYPGHVKCTLVFSAISEEELLQAVVQHGVTVHGDEETPEFREMVRKGMKEAGSQPRRISPPEFREMVRKGMKEAGSRPSRISPPEFREMVRKGMKEAGPRTSRISRWRAA